MIKMYMKVKGSNTRKIEIGTYYYKGGRNWFTGKIDERGYYLAARLVETIEKDGWVQGSCSSGRKMLIKAVTEASKEQEDEADKQALQYINILVDKICAENNVEIE